MPHKKEDFEKEIKEKSHYMHGKMFSERFSQEAKNKVPYYVGAEQVKAFHKLGDGKVIALETLGPLGVTPKMMHQSVCVKNESWSVADTKILAGLIVCKKLAPEKAISVFNEHYPEFYKEGFNSTLGKVYHEYKELNSKDVPSRGLAP